LTKLKSGSGALAQWRMHMSANAEQNIKVLKLDETHAEERARNTNEAATMLRLWTLLGDDSGLRDQTIGQHNFL